MAVQAASGSRVAVAVVQETAVGVTPATPTGKFLRLTGDKGLIPRRTQVRTRETRADRMRPAALSGFNDLGGTFGLQISRGDIEDLLRWQFGGVWVIDGVGPEHVLDVGTTMYSLTAEKRYPDLATPAFQGFRGVVLNDLTLNLMPGDTPVTASVTLVGTTALAFATTSLFSATTAVTNNPPMNQYNGTVTLGGTVLGIVTGLSINTANGRTLQQVFGSRDAAAVLEGEGFAASGELTVLFEDPSTVYNIAYADTASNVKIRLTEPGAAGNWIEFEYPAARLTFTGENTPEAGPVTHTYAIEGDPGTPTGTPAGTTNLRVRTSYAPATLS